MHRYLLAICILIVIILIFGQNTIIVIILFAYISWNLLDLDRAGFEKIGGIEKDDFPYKKLNIKIKDLDARFDRLKTFEFHIVPRKYNIKNVDKTYQQYGGRQMVIDHPKSYYDTYDNISDYFIEHMRVKCVRSDQKMSVFDYWNHHKKDIEMHCKSKYGKVNSHNLRESLYDLIYECNTFKPSLIVGFIKMFKPKSILDISAGWGDRLIGSMACNVDYIGVDPADLHTEYKNMIEHFGHTSSTMLIKGKFEDPDILKDLNKKVDMIFSSPPFYDLEKYYSNDESQSYMNRSVDDWFNNFLIVSIKKAWSFLNEGGHLVLYIADAYNRKPYVQRMINEINKFGSYKGCLPQMDLKQNIPRPFWIWRKSVSSPFVKMMGVVGF